MERVAKRLAPQVHVWHETQQPNLPIEVMLRLHRMRLCSRRDQKPRVGNPERHRLPHRRGGGEDQAYLRPIGLNAAVWRVVKLKLQAASGRNLLGRARGKDRRHVARRVAAELAVGIAGDSRTASLRRLHEHENVVDDRRVARPGLGRLHPDILGEAGGHSHRDVGHGALGGHGIALRNLEHDIGCADRPALGPLSRRRVTGTVARGRTLIHPRQEHGPFPGREPAFVGKLAVAGVGMPGRHPSVGHDLDDHRGMAPSVGSGQ